jgi:hypothetical protein
MAINVRRVVSEIAVKDSPTSAEKFLPTREVLRVYCEYITKCLETGTEIVSFGDYVGGIR